MYKHPDNQRIVDEYKNILIDCNRKGSINQLENARLTRLKTLVGAQQDPVGALLHPRRDAQARQAGRSRRAGLPGRNPPGSRGDLPDRGADRRQHHRRGHEAAAPRQTSGQENRDHTFEHILLETGKACDEKIHEGGDLALLEHFSYIVTYFDRYDSTYANINELAFMENVRYSEEQIRSLLGNKKAFDELDPTLWKRAVLQADLREQVSWPIRPQEGAHAWPRG